MDRRAATGLLLRFTAGLAGSVLVGAVVSAFVPAFREGLLDPRQPYFQVVSLGALAAAMLALVRARHARRALELGAAFALLAGWSAWHGWAVAARVSLAARSAHAATSVLRGAVIAGGIFLAAELYDALAEEGYRLGKFLVTGPLVGGALWAATPVAALGYSAAPALAEVLWVNALLGVVIGDGVGFGVEILELLPRESRGGGT